MFSVVIRVSIARSKHFVSFFFCSPRKILQYNNVIKLPIIFKKKIFFFITNQLVLTVFRCRRVDSWALRPALSWNNRPSPDRRSTAKGTWRYRSDRSSRRPGPRGPGPRSTSSTARRRPSSRSRSYRRRSRTSFSKTKP